MDKNKQKRIKRSIRHNRVRSIVSGTSKRPRLAVFRANQHIYAQLIDDSAGKTLVSASSLELNLPALPTGRAGGKAEKKGKKSEVALEVGKLAASKALAKKIKEVVFDRAGYAFHGRIKALAEGAREGGLKF